jgi:hypothetical protein
MKIALLTEFINNQSKVITDENEDIFIRYLSYARLKCIMTSTSHAMENFKETLADGHNLSHSFFHTKKYEDGGWGDIKIENIAFFSIDETKDNEDKPGH